MLWIKGYGRDVSKVHVSTESQGSDGPPSTPVNRLCGAAKKPRMAGAATYESSCLRSQGASGLDTSTAQSFRPAFPWTFFVVQITRPSHFAAIRVLQFYTHYGSWHIYPTGAQLVACGHYNDSVFGRGMACCHAARVYASGTHSLIWV